MEEQLQADRRPSDTSGGHERTVIGQGVTVTGDIASTGTIQVDGIVDGTIDASGVVVGSNGSVKGSVRTDKLSVAGTIHGDINARDASLASTARVNAEITVRGPLAVEEGAQLEGDLHCAGAGKQAS